MDDNSRTGELRRKLDKDPGSRLFAQLAEELRKEGKLDEAISVARKGLEKNPNYPSARLTLARALLDSGRPQEARPELEQIVKASPDNIMASRLLGDALEGMGELAQAMKQFEKTLLFSPGDKGALEKIAQLKGRLAPAAPPPPPATTVPTPEAAAPAVPVEAAAPASLPSVFGDEPAAATAVPSVFDAPAAVSPLPSVIPEEPPSAPAPEAPAAAAVALDRDLASGTFSPGSLNAADLQKHFEETAASEAGASPAPVTRHDTVSFHEAQAALAQPAPLPTRNDTVGLGDVQAALNQPAPAELPSVEMKAEAPDPGGATLPLSSMTLADLYLQQGLKAEASAVLAQVVKEEPENAQAKSKFAAVSGDLAGAVAAAPSLLSPAPVRARRTRAEVRNRAIASLRVFASAAEREAVNQRATERGAF